jgi:hypothetical protein
MMNGEESRAALKTVSTQSMMNMTDKDGYILYSYCLRDGETAASGKSDPTITAVKESDGVKFVFKDHVLSCGTHMTGWIKKSAAGAVTRYRCDFNVTNNGYKITILTCDYSVDSKANTRKGSLIVNDRQIDINLFM